MVKMMTADQLKASILQLAMEGKLVEQRSEEGTGEELFKIDLKRRNKHISLRDLSSVDNPFEIPGSWIWVRLGDVCEIVRGGSPRPIKSYLTTRDDGVNWIKIGDTIRGQKYINTVKEKIIPAGIARSRMVYKGNLLLTNSMSYGHPYILNVDGCIHDGWLSFSDFESVYDKDFLYYLLSSPGLRTQFAKSAAGAVVKNLNIEKVKDAVVPLLPLAEQYRIVQKIEKLMPLVEEYAMASEKLDKLNSEFSDQVKKSILQMAVEGKLVEQRPEEGTGEELFQKIQEEKAKLVKEGKIKKQKPLADITDDEKPFDIPDTWKWVRVGDVCVNFQYGTARKSEKKGEKIVLRMGNIQGGRIIYKDLVYTSDADDIIKYDLIPGDLLFNRTNSKELVGKVALYKGEHPAIYAGYLVRFTPKVMDSEYLNFVMQTRYYWSYCQTVRSDAISQSNINAEQLKRFVFPLPPLSEQKRIVAKLKTVLPQISQLC